jgi:hypothetical protein
VKQCRDDGVRVGPHVGKHVRDSDGVVEVRLTRLSFLIAVDFPPQLKRTLDSCEFPRWKMPDMRAKFLPRHTDR